MHLCRLRVDGDRSHRVSCDINGAASGAAFGSPTSSTRVLMAENDGRLSYDACFAAT